jgi:uncharacterized membrane protein
MPLTYFYAEIFGIVIFAAALAMLINRRDTIIMMHELMDSRPVLYAFGFMILFIGVITVLTHNIWSGDALTILVTLVGWAMILKAFVLLFLPHGSLRKLFNSFQFEKLYYLIAVIALILGIFLTYFGFTGY